MKAATKYIAKQPDADGIVHFTEEEHETWSILAHRQQTLILNRACDEFVAGIERLNLPTDRIPQVPEMNKVLNQCTGWSVEPVAAIIPLSTFFNLLANRKFPAATFIRIREELDYLPEPDLFHEYFGHCPLLTHQAYADFMEWYGKTALQADKKLHKLLGRLFWFTIEFGLLKQGDEMRIYGGGILSSKDETLYALESDQPKRIPLSIEQALRTPYRYDQIQPLYYYLDSLDDLYRIMECDMVELASHAVEDGDIEPSFIIC